ncbi:hypothetical protein F7C95_14625 [Opitutia bacterium ISCC 51]|nr:hypothetical protein F7C95_14625 [Opitutae bacterium ISCC 51]
MSYFDHFLKLEICIVVEFKLQPRSLSLKLTYVLVLLFLAHCFVIVAHKREGNTHFQWALLGIIFPFLALDEASSIHETIGYLVFVSNIPILIYPPWVLPHSILLIFGGVIYFPFLKNLPDRFRKLFVLAGGTFVLGALGFEIIFGKLYNIYHDDYVSVAIFATVEELLEFGGLIIFI